MSSNEMSFNVRTARAILSLTSERSPVVRRDAVTAAVRLAANRTKGGKVAERIRTAVKLLSDQGWVKNEITQTGALLRVLERPAIEAWLENGAPYLERSPATQHEGRSCRQKIAHATAEEASRVAQTVSGTFYRCQYGEHYHVTTKAPAGSPIAPKGPTHG